MRLALTHDYLNQFGGAERFLLFLCEIFPEAPIYTLFYDEAKTLGRFKGRTIITSRLNKKMVINNHRFFIPLMPWAINNFLVNEQFDLVISSTSGYAKGIRFPKKTIHIAYCHTPLRYAWEDEDYLHTHPLFKGKPLLGKISKPLINYLKNWDYEAAQRPTRLIANSEFISKKISAFYKRRSEVINPPVDLKVFYPDRKRERNYFLAIGRFLHYKRFDLVIKSFNTLNLPLKVIGGGPEKNRLRKLIKSQNTELIDSYQTDEELRLLYSGAKALIFPQVEDFGLVAAEAMACGTPVIAYRAGGVREIVTEDKSGIFFNHQSEDDLCGAVLRFNKMRFNQSLVRKEAVRFSKEKFKKKFLKIIQQIN